VDVQAATNHHAKACHDMASALLEGYGTHKNSVEGYAWLKLYAGTPDGSAFGRVELNQLALQMDTEAIGRAEALAAETLKLECCNLQLSGSWADGDETLPGAPHPFGGGYLGGNGRNELADRPGCPAGSRVFLIPVLRSNRQPN
jgi:hypothetical protein